MDANGDPDVYDPFIYDDSPPQSIAEADRPNPDCNQFYFAHIDYNGGLNPGTYYIRVMKGPTDDPLAGGYYAIRVLSLKIGEALDPVTPIDKNDIDSYEPDADIHGMMTNPNEISLSDILSMCLESGGSFSVTNIDLFKLVLPPLQSEPSAGL